MANIVTFLRIPFSIALLFFPALSPAYFGFYIAAGFTDMTDGTIARKTNTVSEFGSKLDTVADLIFVIICLITLLPVLHIPKWIYIWISIIAAIKIIGIIYGFIKNKKFEAIHSIPNKITGALLFALPLTLSFIDIKITAVVVCLSATAAAIHELIIIVKKEK